MHGPPKVCREYLDLQYLCGLRASIGTVIKVLITRAYDE